MELDTKCLGSDFLKADFATLDRQKLYFMFPPLALEHNAIQIAVTNQIPAIIIATWSNFPLPNWLALLRSYNGNFQFLCQHHDRTCFKLDGQPVRAGHSYSESHWKINNKKI